MRHLPTLADLVPMNKAYYPKVLLLVFVMTLPLINPWVRGDGGGYYAYVRALLIQHNLRFEDDWLHSSPLVPRQKIDAAGHIDTLYTRTGHLPNRYSVGPSLLWAPFLVPVHLVMVALAKAGRNVQVDGFSKPYVVTAALATALYGFLGLLVSYRLARRYAEGTWAFLATLGIWFASSLPVYMYFDPFYSHSHSVFIVAIFLWYWGRTRSQRSMAQWAVLGLLSGLMLDIYYLNIALLCFPFLESVQCYGQAWRRGGGEAWRKLFLANLLYLGVTLAAFLPSLITRQIIYGNPLEHGYEPSSWLHPALWQTLLSANHGLLSWTPIVVPSLAGLFLLRRDDPELAAGSVAAFVAMYYIVACHPDWHGISAFGNRFFLSLTPLFILGLAVFLQETNRWFGQARAAIAVSALAMSLLVLWNLAFIFQWGIGLVPHRGPVSWKQVVHNQFTVVPFRLGGSLKSYFTNRSGMMQHIEREDVQQLRRN